MTMAHGTVSHRDGGGAQAGAWIVGPDDPILVTGAAGFIGARVVRGLLDRGFRRVRCLTRPSGDRARFEALVGGVPPGAALEIVEGNLLSPEDCRAATRGAALVVHLAAARGEKSFPDAYLNSVVTTRNLLDAVVSQGVIRRFVNISSFAVYTNNGKPRRGVLDESCPVEPQPHLRGHAYTFAKAKQDDIVREYGERHGLPYVIIRPGYVYGPGNEAITIRVGIGTFGVFLHLGGPNTVPLTFVDNCADAIVLAGLAPGVDGQVFNIVDDDLPSSRGFLRLYKRQVRRFRSIYLPHAVSYALCWLWEAYSDWSEGQLPPAYNRRAWYAFWKRTRYSNDKAKRLLGWTPRVSTAEGLNRYFASCREKVQHA
jgi:nucleoside-diphosphate-sugar epimerase